MLLSLIVVNTAQSNDPIVHLKCMDIPGGTSGKELTCQCKKKKREGLFPGLGRLPWRRA